MTDISGPVFIEVFLPRAFNDRSYCCSHHRHILNLEESVFHDSITRQYANAIGGQRARKSNVGNECLRAILIERVQYACPNSTVVKQQGSTCIQKCAHRICRACEIFLAITGNNQNIIVQIMFPWHFQISQPIGRVTFFIVPTQVVWVFES